MYKLKFYNASVNSKDKFAKLHLQIQNCEYNFAKLKLQIYIAHVNF